MIHRSAKDLMNVILFNTDLDNTLSNKRMCSLGSKSAKSFEPQYRKELLGKAEMGLDRSPMEKLQDKDLFELLWAVRPYSKEKNSQSPSAQLQYYKLENDVKEYGYYESMTSCCLLTGRFSYLSARAKMHQQHFILPSAAVIFGFVSCINIKLAWKWEIFIYPSLIKERCYCYQKSMGWELLLCHVYCSIIVYQAE